MFNQVKSSALSVAEKLTPVLKSSRFKETGVLTPEEFVVAGDHLVHICPTWQWASGDCSKTKSYLPSEKQFLITRNVPCYQRCKHLNYTNECEEIVDVDADGGWVDTHHHSDLLKAQEGLKEMTLSKEPEVSKSDVNEEDDDDDEEVMDMEKYAEMLDDDDEVLDLVETKPATSGNDEDNIVHTRTYDLHITYDNYYRTPRVWLSGYSEKSIPLKMEEMYEDMSQEHVEKTVTLEPHPHLPPPSMCSIHPCRHAAVMKKMMERIEDGGGSLEVNMYLLVFLKFIQAAIPTIEYDYTRHIHL